MLVFEFEIPSEVHSYDVRGMMIHNAPHAVGTKRIILPEHSLNLVTQPGTLNISWNNGKTIRRDIAPGDVSFVPKGTEFTARTDKPCSGAMVRIDQSVIDAADAETGFQFAMHEFQLFRIHGLTKIGESILSLATGGVLESNTMLSETLSLAIVSEAAKNMCPKAEKDFRPRGCMSKSQLKRVVDYVECNLHQAISLGDLSSVANMSQFHFSRAFKLATGCTPSAFVLRRRIERAKKHLMSDGSLALIAIDCGFSSQSHFTTAFRDLTGATPGAYRKSAQ